MVAETASYAVKQAMSLYASAERLNPTRCRPGGRSGPRWGSASDHNGRGWAGMITATTATQAALKCALMTQCWSPT